jgi:hypothetical protein
MRSRHIKEIVGRREATSTFVFVAAVSSLCLEKKNKLI